MSEKKSEGPRITGILFEPKPGESSFETTERMVNFWASLGKISSQEAADELLEKLDPKSDDSEIRTRIEELQILRTPPS